MSLYTDSIFLFARVRGLCRIPQIYGDGGSVDEGCGHRSDRGFLVHFWRVGHWSDHFCERRIHDTIASGTKEIETEPMFALAKEVERIDYVFGIDNSFMHFAIAYMLKHRLLTETDLKQYSLACVLI